MATIKPFRAIRPNKEVAAKVAALPYDVMNSQEARKMVEGNPYSFLHVDKAEIDLDPSVDLYDAKVYEKARDNLQKMMQDQVLIQEKESAFYIYRLTMAGRAQMGLVVCTSIDEYLDGTIKKHELTRADKEQDRIRHVDVCNANTGPIFLAYRAQKEISMLLQSCAQQQAPLYDFVSEDGIGHTVWVISDAATIEKLQQLFASVPNFYIADGHHRNASAVKVGLKRREATQAYDPNAEFNFYLSVLFPDNELAIMDYNRLVKDLNGFEKEAFLEKVQQHFEVVVVTEKVPYAPKEPHTFGMYLDHQWYQLTAKKESIGTDPVGCLDVSILQKYVLSSILGIENPQKDQRIDFVGGIRGLGELERRVDSGEMIVAFSMFPTSMEELFQIADNNEIMPPKSTWFEPKLRSGLFIHSLE